MTDSLHALNTVVGNQIPVPLDHAVRLQFPCQQPFDHRDGVTKTLVNQISSDRHSWEAYFGAGPLSWVQILSRPDTIPSYLRGDWSSDRCEIAVISPLVPTTVSARLNRSAVRGSELWPPRTGRRRDLILR
jgi:hypothetical protein